MRRIGFSGGLGDVLYGIYVHDSYAVLDTLTKKVQAVIDSPNPGVREMIELHPKAKEGLIEVIEGRNADPPGHRGDLPIRFYPSQKDLHEISKLEIPYQEDFSKLNVRYMVFGLSSGAGSYLKNIPYLIAEQARDVAWDLGFQVALVGRRYSMKSEDRSEVNVPGCVDLIDRLSVHGLMTLLERSVAAFCAYSSVMIGAWRLGIPTAAFYPKEAEADWKANQYCTFGQHFKTTLHGRFDQWNTDVFMAWLRQHARRG